MGDSDDEDRGHSRDKFRRERSDYGSDRTRSRGEKRTWREESDSYGGRRHSRSDEHDEGRRRFSGGYGRGGRDWSPPPKRMRTERWSASYSVPGMIMPYGIRPPWPMHPHPSAHHMSLPVDSGVSHNSGRPSRHAMLTFKQFLTQQDDDIEESDAIARYNSYKEDFKKKMMEEFFEQHKEEDWLISKYHPKRVELSKEKDAKNLESRVEAFKFLWDSGQLDSVPLTTDNSEQIIKIMDTAVIKMEGGSEQDLLSLDVTYTEPVEDSPSAKDDSPFRNMDETEQSKEMAEQRNSRENSESSMPEGGNSSEATDEKQPPELETKPEEASTETQINGAKSKPRALHITRSVYIRHIPAKISANDIQEVCRTLPGFLRVAFADPSPEKGYDRRGWATYTADADIKEVIARLNTKRIKDCLLNCMLNRDLSRRVKQSASPAWASKAFQTDLQNAVKLVRFLDEKTGLWEHSAGDDKSANPVLAFPEALLEEEPVSMATGDEEEGAITEPGTEIVDGSSEKMKLLDRLLWYLRVVHSLDYYGCTVFPSEDSMPHRCGVFTIRPEQPEVLELQKVNEYMSAMEGKVKPLLVKKKLLSPEEVTKLGGKDPEAEVEKFVELNTQKLAESKYLCPLSGKKFKGPDFVRKHIFNKHMDKVEEFKQEAVFFNCYLGDPDRPMPVESVIASSVLPSKPKTPGSDNSPSGALATSPWGQQGGINMFGRGGGFSPSMGRGGFSSPDMMNRGGGGFRGRGGGRRGRGRRVVDYNDLDAPEEMY